jgi:hypothetical protein
MDCRRRRAGATVGLEHRKQVRTGASPAPARWHSHRSKVGHYAWLTDDLHDLHPAIITTPYPAPSLPRCCRLVVRS